MTQSASHVMMVQPAHFGYNVETSSTNAFQRKKNNDKTALSVSLTAQKEFDELVTRLRNVGVTVTVIEDTEKPLKPDAVFPNNWISFHRHRIVVTYPMFAPNRRLERREDIIQRMSHLLKIHTKYDLSMYEKEGKYLEGTGSMVLDRDNKLAYACLSPRTDSDVLTKFSMLMGYQIISFHSVDKKGHDIYHTNVMMSLGKDVVIICLECIKSTHEKNQLISYFKATNKEIIKISLMQMNHFAGNSIEVMGTNGQKYFIMSSTAYNSLEKSQVEVIESYHQILHVAIPTIEFYGGGGVRCMLVEIPLMD